MMSIRRSSSPLDLRPLEEIEAAAVAADIVDQRVVAVGADAGRQADDGRVLRHEIGDAAHDERRAERHDEGGHFQLGDDDAIDEADESRGAHDRRDEADDDRRKERHAGVEGRRGCASADSTEARLITQPTDRSMPAAMMTKV